MSSLAAISSFVRTPSCSRRFAVAIFLAVIFLGRPRSVMIKILPGSFRTSYSTCTSPSTATRIRRPTPLQRAIPYRRTPCTVLTIPALISASCRPSRWKRRATGARRRFHMSLQLYSPSICRRSRGTSRGWWREDHRGEHAVRWWWSCSFLRCGRNCLWSRCRFREPQ